MYPRYEYVLAMIPDAVEDGMPAGREKWVNIEPQCVLTHGYDSLILGINHDSL